MLHLLLCTILAGATTDGVTAKFVPEGVTQKVGGYRPVRAQLDKEATIVTKAPEDLRAPKYGQIEIGDQKWSFILDEPKEGEDGDTKLFVDTNADGDLTNDPEASWEAVTRGESTMYNGSAQVQLGESKLGKINLYRFDPNDEARAALASTILYYSDFGTEYLFELDGKEFSSFVSGSISEDDALWIDRDGNGKSSRNYEMAKIGEPFNFTGTTYLFSVDNGNLKMKKSDVELPQSPMPPDLRIGKPALTFTAKTLDGTEIDFPKSYAGKIVMLDFWATWCGPCIGEIPNMKEAYTAWHEQGFEILGISFDQADMEEKLNDFLTEKELPWPQIYDGRGWDNALGQMHDVSGIPFVLLVDGDSGEILATSRELRGDGLAKYIGEVLEKKKSGQ